MFLISLKANHQGLLAALAGAIALGPLTSAAPASGRILYVDDDAVSGGSGRSWRSAIRILQDALEIAATEGDVAEIRVGEGTYTPDDGEGHLAGDRRASFELNGAVTLLRGGYAGLAYRDHDAWDPDRYLTNLSGDLEGNDKAEFSNFDDNSYHVVRVSTEADGPLTLLEGFWISGGNANGHHPVDAIGGGLLADHGNVHVSYARFVANYAASYGGAIASDGGKPVVSDSEFAGNAAGAYGGAIAFDNAVATIVRNLFWQNGATDQGGAISFYNSAAEIRSSRFTGNSAHGAGGAILNHYSDVNVFNTVFHGNSAGWGGALFSDHGSAHRITNVTFFANMAQLGGALHILGESTSIANTIFWNNRDASDDLTTGQIKGEATVSHSLLEGGWEGAGGAGIIDDDPRFVNGPLDLRLQPGSPAIDAGDNGAVPSALKDDLAGAPRFIDDPKTPDTGEGRSQRKVAIVDLGAYEFQAGAKN